MQWNKTKRTKAKRRDSNHENEERPHKAANDQRDANAHFANHQPSNAIKAKECADRFERNGQRHGILAASALLTQQTTAVCADFETTLIDATSTDLVYLDPPYEGTTTGDNKRYHQGLDHDRLIAMLDNLNSRHIPFLLSYDGQCGEKIYGSELPSSLHLTRLKLNAGRSSQATLNGREEVTIESLYVSRKCTESP